TTLFRSRRFIEDQQRPPAERPVEEARIESPADFSVVGDTDPNDLTQAGGAVMFPPGTPPEVKEALKPLLEHRKAQVANDKLFKVFDGAETYRAPETGSAWLGRRGGSRDPGGAVLRL